MVLQLWYVFFGGVFCSPLISSGHDTQGKANEPHHPALNWEIRETE